MDSSIVSSVDPVPTPMLPLLSQRCSKPSVATVTSAGRWIRGLQWALAGALVAASSLLACAAESDSPTDPDDGKVHPAPNGVHISEDQACSALVDAFQGHALALGCSATMRPCPTYLRAQFQTPCMEYDEGSVTGCVDYFRSLSSCADLDPTMCVVTAYPGTEPGGCPP